MQNKGPRTHTHSTAHARKTRHVQTGCCGEESKSPKPSPASTTEEPESQAEGSDNSALANLGGFYRGRCRKRFPICAPLCIESCRSQCWRSSPPPRPLTCVQGTQMRGQIWPLTVHSRLTFDPNPTSRYSSKLVSNRLRVHPAWSVCHTRLCGERALARCSIYTGRLRFPRQVRFRLGDEKSARLRTQRQARGGLCMIN